MTGMKKRRGDQKNDVETTKKRDKGALTGGVGTEPNQLDVDGFDN